MTGRERFGRILNREGCDRTGFWLGYPSAEAKRKYVEGLGIRSRGEEAREAGKLDVDLAAALESDFVWVCPDQYLESWKHPEGKPVFDVLDGRERQSLNEAGALKDCRTADDVKRFCWPDPGHWDFGATLDVMDYARSKGKGVASGMWSPFFHIAADLFGMDNYFMKMYTHPEVVMAATEKVVEFYLESNERFLSLAAGKMDVMFFGNDLGSQVDLLISPECFDKFLLPGYRRLVAQAKGYGLKVMHHSCGAIGKIIPRFIDIGIDALHPLQAKASGMEAERLAREFGKDLIWVGGVDTQELLPFGTAEEVRKRVGELRGILGPGYVVSPSHEALLVNVGLENVLAMKEAAIG